MIFYTWQSKILEDCWNWKILVIAFSEDNWYYLNGNGIYKKSSTPVFLELTNSWTEL